MKSDSERAFDHCDFGCDRNKNLVSKESRVDDENRQKQSMNDIPECPIDSEDNGEIESHLSNNEVTGGDENNNKVPRERSSPIGKSWVFLFVFQLQKTRSILF